MGGPLSPLQRYASADPTREITPYKWGTSGRGAAMGDGMAGFNRPLHYPRSGYA